VTKLLKAGAKDVKNSQGKFAKELGDAVIREVIVSFESAHANAVAASSDVAPPPVAPRQLSVSSQALITKFFDALRAGSYPQVKECLESNVDVLARDSDGNTCMHLATKSGNAEMAELLLDHKANIDDLDQNGYSPLMIAVSERHKQLISTLLMKKARLNFKSKDTEQTALMIAICNGIPEVAEKLIFSGAAVKGFDKEGNTTLLHAAEFGYSSLVNILIGKGVNVNCANKKGITPLTAAIRNGHVDCAAILLDRGANIEAREEDNRTPLLIAVHARQTECTQLLLSRGANCSIFDRDGQTALDWALQAGAEDLVALLVTFESERSSMRLGREGE